MGAELLLREAYDVTYGIFDHIRQAEIEKRSAGPEGKRPLALVEFHPAEDASGAMRLEEVATVFADLKIGEKFNMSFQEYLELPHYWVEVLTKVSKTLATKEGAAINKAFSEFDGQKNR